MFIFRKLFLVDFFLHEEGEGLETPRDFKTPQEENNFQVKT